MDPVPPGTDFASFVRARSTSLLKTAYLLTGDQHLAEDLVQTALARTHLAWDRLHAAGNAEAYTRKIMYHQQVSWWRRRRRGSEVVTDVPPEGPSTDTMDGAAVRLTLREALRRLTPKQRAVLVLRFYDDLSERETAEALDCSVGTVKSQTSRALARLRQTAPELAEFGELSLAEEASR
jgi:RNA polymerase sigma-70 factor (sigma-E family)